MTGSYNSCKISHSSLNTECLLNRWSRTLLQQSSLRIFWDQVGIWHSLQAWRLLHLHRQVPLSYRFHSYLWHIMRYKWIDNWLSGVSEFWTIAVAAEVTQEHYRKSHVKKERDVEIYEKYDPGTIQGYCRPISGRMLWLWTGEKALAFVFVFFLCRQSWGHRRNMQLKDVLSMEELIETLVITVRWEFYTD